MVRPSKDKKDATTMPVSKDVKNMKGDTPMQKEFKKKYGAKATALDAVKQKYKGQMMNVKKEEVQRDEYGDPVGGPKISKKQKAKNLASNTPDEQHTTTTSEMFGGSSSGGRADRGDEVGRRERVKRAQEAKAKRAAVKDTPIDKYQGCLLYTSPSPRDG